MSIIYLIIAFVSLVIFIVCLIIDQELYEKRIVKTQNKIRYKKKLEEKKKPKEFKWPDNLPHYDLYL